MTPSPLLSGPWWGVCTTQQGSHLQPVCSSSSRRPSLAAGFGWWQLASVTLQSVGLSEVKTGFRVSVACVISFIWCKFLEKSWQVHPISFGMVEFYNLVEVVLWTADVMSVSKTPSTQCTEVVVVLNSQASSLAVHTAHVSFDLLSFSYSLSGGPIYHRMETTLKWPSPTPQCYGLGQATWPSPFLWPRRQLPGKALHRVTSWSRWLPQQRRK